MSGYQLHWVDIEDHSDAMEDVEIQTFPTIVVQGGDASILFAGPIEPRMGTLTRLLEALPSTDQTAPGNEGWVAVIANLKAAGVG
jgi:thioredoxin 1